MNSVSASTSFLLNFMQFVLESAQNNHSDNYDFYRFGPRCIEAKGESVVKRAGRRLARSLGFVTNGEAKLESNAGIRAAQKALNEYLPHLEEIEWLNSVLVDDLSRKTLREVLAYRAMGDRKVRLSQNTTEFWSKTRELVDSAKGADSIDLGFLGFTAAKMNLSRWGYPIDLYFVPFAVYQQFIMEPYRCVTNGEVVEAVLGDVVLDCGGCYGDTALYFAHKVGESGKVFSFEFVPSNLKLWNTNVAMNAPLRTRIQLVESPVWASSGESLFIEENGPGSKVHSTRTQPHFKESRTIAIDDLVYAHDLRSVDFIKMDIEGAELAALQGAAETIKKFRPKLAISVYHNLTDFWSVPKFLEGLDVGYRFSLRHFTIHAEETVLFASVGTNR